MSAKLRTSPLIVRTVIRQVESSDGLQVFSTVQGISGFRFVEETNIHEPAGPGYDEYWYWEITHESGIYATEQEAFDEGVRIIPWLQIQE